MITLITFAPSFGQVAASPFCVKAIWLLNMSGQSWNREDTADPRSMPKQKLPAIRVSDTLIADSDNIRVYLETLGADFDAGLSDMEKSTSRAFIRMAEDTSTFTTFWHAGGTMQCGRSFATPISHRFLNLPVGL